MHLCINFGEPSPYTNRPESACGAWYLEKNSDSCKIHPGFIKNGNFTCCGADRENLDGCTEGKHSTFAWPDERAKLYFYPRPLSNPAMRYVESFNKLNTGQLICRCDFFKPIKPYDNPLTKMELLRMKREKEKDEPRYCFRWACEKMYKEVDNTERSCLCHPGKWDHGSTGTKMTVFVSEMATFDKSTLNRTTILWKPHWTCCRGAWDSRGKTHIFNI